MRAYSEIIASFRRSGPFPIEADYIFETEAKLKEFYSSPEENAILHKGLLKVVENDGDGNQALYWVTRKETNDELEFTKLITSKSDETIADLITRLEQEIKDRKTADDAIWGSVDHTSVPGDLNSLKDIAKEITKIREHLGNLDSTDEELQSNIDSHLKDFNNPHRVTPAQIGAISLPEVEILLKSKADLVSGKVPKEQIPDDIGGKVTWIDVEGDEKTVS